MTLFIFLLLSLSVICLLYLHKKTSNPIAKSKINLHSNQINYVYNSKNGNFEIQGTISSFVITKNKTISFLIKNGQIVACKDIRNTNKFIYYREVNSDNESC